jgi:hypothetical protein
MPGVADGVIVGPDGLGVTSGVGSNAEFNVGVTSAKAERIGSVGSGVWVAVGCGSFGSREHPAMKMSTKIMKIILRNHRLELVLKFAIGNKNLNSLLINQFNHLQNSYLNLR